MTGMVLAMVLSVAPAGAAAKTIVVLGDSISAGYGIEVQLGWVALLQKKLVDAGSPHAVFNESISGDTSAGGLARLESILARHKPDVVVLELGANDGLRGLSPQEMKRNLTEIVNRSRHIGAEVLLLAMKIPPNYGKRYIEMFYEVYPQLAGELRLAWVPFILEDIALKPELMQADGLHPNADAQPALVEKIWPSLLPLLK
ncbi:MULTISPECIES: arylesterase [Methylomonas]|uniref:Arylesterase n=1 Tax=Methylomonas koyamae TaxID=702114 RepID=A0A177PIG7_9GAMM|nr:MULTISPECIES: arylesterase [Methylomonas]OAI29189.1 arylesterase [Methylomonas koyamae]WGS85945.1 arylesterase [Methylomonas sp. UP202]